MVTHDERRIALVALRERLRITQLDIARACRINRTSLSLWENNFANLPVETLNRIEDYLRDQLAELQALGNKNERAEREYIPLSGLGLRRPELEN